MLEAEILVIFNRFSADRSTPGVVIFMSAIPRQETQTEDAIITSVFAI
jgi:hypothetical protein